MSLDTVLHIGKTIKEKVDESERIQYFRFSRKPSFKDETPIFWFSVNIKMTSKQYTIDWNSLHPIPENQRENMFYFLNKTSDQDSSAPTYLWGDIWYSLSVTEEKSNSFRIRKDNSLDKLYNDKNYLNSFLSGDNKKKKQEKEFLQKYINGEEIKDENYNFVSSIINANPILMYWQMMKREKTNIEAVLSYTPVIKSFVPDLNEVESAYKKYVWENLKSKKPVKDSINDYIRRKKTEDIEIKASDVSFEDLGDDTNKFLEVGDHCVFLHFNFIDEKGKTSWYEQERTCSYIYSYLIEKITEYNDGKTVLSNLIYPTLCSGNEKNDCQFPNFKSENKYKSFFFSEEGESLYNLLYADRILKTTKKWIKGTDINIIILPKSIDREIDIQSLLAFFFENKSENSLFDTSCFDCFDEEESQQIVFDYVFVNTSGQTSVYLFDIAGLQKSILKEIESNIKKTSHNISEEIRETHHWEHFNTSIEDAYTVLLGMCQNNEGNIKFVNQVKVGNESKPYAPYQSHMLKVVPKIYTQSFYDDNLLLPSLIEKTEFCVRNGKEENTHNYYIKIKYSFKFLLNIQNNKTSKYMEITSSPSYLIGQRLGQLAKPLGRKINTFQKNYVGMLTRRASTKSDAIELANDIIEKLVMHDCSYQTSLCGEVCANIASLNGYDKEQFAFGFFEGYFKYVANDASNTFVEKAEKLISDFSSNEDLSEALNNIKNIVEELKNK
ncbi:MAG: hypothetical protein MJZ28_10305 [Paludibacteraceae bacterium]|nr:hypothetical protein [Paludibacteraceae bacterium]